MLNLSLFDIYMAAAVLGGGYVVLSALLGNLHFSAGEGGGEGVGVPHGDVGHGMPHDAHHEAHHTGHVVDATDERRRAFGLFSPTVVASFLAGFGGVGLVMQRGYGWGQASALPALGGGIVLAACLMAVYNKLARAASSSSHALLKELIGVRASVTTPIGADSPGEIAYVLHGSRFSRSARSADGKPIARGAEVTIEALDRQNTYVLKLDDVAAHSTQRRPVS